VGRGADPRYARWRSDNGHEQLNPLKDEKGNVSAILEISSDITERKKAESALQEAQEELRQDGENKLDPFVHSIILKRQ